MPDHTTLWENIWLVVGISLGGGGFATQALGVLLGASGFGIKLFFALGVAGIIFGTIWFFGSAPHA